MRRVRPLHRGSSPLPSATAALSSGSSVSSLRLAALRATLEVREQVTPVLGVFDRLGSAAEETQGVFVSRDRLQHRRHFIGQLHQLQLVYLQGFGQILERLNGWR